MAGRKVFTSGEILTAADVNSFLMDQSVMVFADSSARSSAIPTPVEGMVTYLSDVNQVQAFTGSAFTAVGTILQVVSTTKTDTFTMASTTFADVTGLSATITPTSSSNKVFILVNISAGSDVTTGTLRGRLLRDSTGIAIGDTASNRTRVTFEEASSNASMAASAMNFLDSPATASAVTYKIQISCNTVNTVAINRSTQDTDIVQRSRGVSSITLMEVAG